jgi:DNA modification methylase
MAKGTYEIITGDSAEKLKNIPSDSIDAVITDPPYGIEFLGKAWDSNTGAVAIWAECLRILKPGGHLLAFSAARTYHHLATNIESVGFEIRDQLMWIYSSGFPKAQDMGKAIDRRLTKQKTDIKAEYNGGKHGPKNVDLGMQGVRCPVCHRDSNARYDCDLGQACGMVYKAQTPEAQKWTGWKTALKPGHEPIVMARKRFRGSTIDNIQQHGVGALNIDATRIMYEDQADLNTYINNIAGPLERSTAQAGEGIGMHEGKTGFKVQKGKVKRPQAGKRTASFSFGNKEPQSGGDGSPEFEANPMGRYPSNVMGDIPDYQKYFYCPKVTRRERHCGFDNKTVGNNHPTVKPVALMRYLIELVTPPRSHIIDPFAGSGTTGMAATELGHRFTGIEQDPAYVEIANKRIQGWLNKHTDKTNTATKHTQESQYDRLFE